MTTHPLCECLCLSDSFESTDGMLIEVLPHTRPTLPEHYTQREVSVDATDSRHVGYQPGERWDTYNEFRRASTIFKEDEATDRPRLSLSFSGRSKEKSASVPWQDLRTVVHRHFYYDLGSPSIPAHASSWRDRSLLGCRMRVRRRTSTISQSSTPPCYPIAHLPDYRFTLV